SPGPLFVQRLRYIKQNSVAYMVFASLRSSRFEHSLGAMELARRVANSLFHTSGTTLIREFSRKVRREFALGSKNADHGRTTPWLACFRQIDWEQGSTGNPDEGSRVRDPGEEWDSAFDEWVNGITSPIGLRARKVGELSQGA